MPVAVNCIGQAPPSVPMLAAQAAAVRGAQRGMTGMTGALTDIRYAQRSVRNRLDLHMPESATRPPLVLLIHGGAFCMGDKADCARYDSLGRAS